VAPQPGIVRRGVAIDERLQLLHHRVRRIGFGEVGAQEEQAQLQKVGVRIDEAGHNGLPLSINPSCIRVGIQHRVVGAHGSEPPVLHGEGGGGGTLRVDGVHLRVVEDKVGGSGHGDIEGRTERTGNRQAISRPPGVQPIA
jgi:hypothetical protein